MGGSLFRFLKGTMADERERMSLPPKFFMYTIDQIATMFEVEPLTVKNNYLHYERRSVGSKPGDKMLARNIAPAGEKPEWRVSEQEVIRYLRKRGFRIYNKTSFS